MSNTLKSVGQLVSKAKGGTAVIDKIDVLNSVEELIDTLHALRDAMMDSRVQTKLRDIARNPKPATAYDKMVKDAYEIYFKALPSSVQMVERRDAFGSLLSAINTGLDDLSQIKESYPDLFGGTQSSDMQATDLKMSAVVTLGYLESLMDLTSWTVYLLNTSLSSVDPASPQVPPYQTTLLKTDADAVAQTVAEIFNRMGNETFLSAIESLRRRGRDVYIETDGHTIDQYADDRDYNTVELNRAQRFMRSGALMIGQAYIQYRQSRYEKLKTMRGWLATKVGLLNLQLSGHADKNSAEYHRLEKVVQNYSNQMSLYDKKITQYEAS